MEPETNSEVFVVTGKTKADPQLGFQGVFSSFFGGCSKLD